MLDREGALDRRLVRQRFEQRWPLEHPTVHLNVFLGHAGGREAGHSNIPQRPDCVADDAVSCELVSAPNSPAIPALRDDPKLVGRDDTKVVGDSVAKAVPFFGNSSPEEAQDCRSELREGFIASVIGDMFVHYAPASFDRIKMRTIGRDEV